MKPIQSSCNQGYIALTSLLIISAVTLAISVTVSLLGISLMQSSLTFTQGLNAKYLAESCIEEALIKLRDSSTYTGGTVTIDNNSCTINISGSNPVFTIQAIGSVVQTPTFVRKLEVITQRSSNSITIISWKEIE